MANKTCKWCGKTYSVSFFDTDNGYCCLKCETEAKDAGKGGCFLTTACVHHAGYSDDCHQLKTLRNFRDNYLANLPNGKAMIKEYYHTAPQIVTAIESHQSKSAILDDMLTTINQAVKAIETNDNKLALAIYESLFNDLKQLTN